MRQIDKELLEAAKSGNLEKFKDLCNNGANTNALNFGRGTLSLAAIGGHVGIIRYLIDYSPPKQPVVNIALSNAIREEKPKIAKLLINAYKPEMEDYYTFGIALEKGYYDILKLLLDFNRANAKNLLSQNVKLRESIELHLFAEAISYGHTDIVKFLVSKYGMRIDSRSIDCLTYERFLRKEQSTDIIKILFESGLDFNSQIDGLNNYSCSLLHMFSNLANFQLIQYSIDNNAKVSAVDLKGNTPLHILMKNTNVDLNDKKELIGLMIKAGANINAQNADGDTPLHILVQSEDLDQQDVKSLVKFVITTHKPNLKIKDELGYSVADLSNRKLRKVISWSVDQTYGGQQTSGLANTSIDCIKNSKEIFNEVVESISILKNFRKSISTGLNCTTSCDYNPSLEISTKLSSVKHLNNHYKVIDRILEEYESEEKEMLGL